jgi:hypothetical protein
MQPIIKNQPIPEIRRKGARPKYPWRDMKPGDAFEFTTGVTLKSAYSAAHQQGENLAMRFVVRRDPDDRIWCWRVDGLSNQPRNGNFREEPDIVRNYTPQRAPVESAEVGWRPRDETPEEVI